MKLYHRSFLLALLAFPACCQTIPFPGPGGVAASWPNGYAHRQLFTFNVHPNSDLSAFPNLISGTYPQLADTAHGGYVNQTVALNGQTVPADLIFTSDSVGSTLLSWEIESWSNTTGAIVAWVKDDRSSSADTLIYAWVGKVGVTSYQCSATATWTDYLGVWHFPNGSTLSLNDSTAASNTMTQSSYGSLYPPTAMAGKVDGAWGTTFVNEYRATAGTSTSAMGNGDSLTISAWIYVHSSTGDEAGLLNVGQAAYPYYNVEIDLFADGTTAGSVEGVVSPSSSALSLGAWHHVVVVYDGSNVSYYIDGNSVGTTSIGAHSAIISNPLYMNTNPHQAAGDVNYDEVRVSGSVHSAAWIAHEYLQQSQANAWFTVASWAP